MFFYLLLIPIIWALWSTSSFFKNRRIAKTIGVPIVSSIVGTNNPLWLVLQKLSFLQPLWKKLPVLRSNITGWQYNDKFKIHEDLGKVFMHVTPAGNELHVADASATDHILSRKKEFMKPIGMLESVDLFGKSLASVDGADWQRHRRITAPPFNERNSALVWVESLRQAHQMLESWSGSGETGIKSVNTDTATLALHVMTCAGFGISYHFCDTLKSVKAGFSMSYGDALAAVMKNIVILVLVPSRVYSFPFLPEVLRDFKLAHDDFKNYMGEMIAGAKTRAAQGEPGDPNLLNTLVQKSEEALAESGGKSSQSGLSDNEIFGNLFIFSFAGHETTANTLAYCVYLLAAFPEWQEWVGDEADYVFRGHDSIETLDYEEIYPQLKRCLALMYETLRVYSQVLFVPKCTGDTPATLNVDGREITVPPHTKVFPNIVALQTLPEYWGKDSLRWRPDRWIEASQSNLPSLQSKEIFPTEKMMVPVRGSYIPWSDGPRVCPGKKFSMVEFVSVIAVVMWKHRIQIVRREGESDEEARERVFRVVENSKTQLTLQMCDPQSVGLTFVKK